MILANKLLVALTEQVMTEKLMKISWPATLGQPTTTEASLDGQDRRQKSV